MTTAIIGVAGALLGATIAGIFAHFREKGNREHALELKRLEIEGQRQQRWYEAREDAFAELV